MSVSRAAVWKELGLSPLWQMQAVHPQANAAPEHATESASPTGLDGGSKSLEETNTTDCLSIKSDYKKLSEASRLDWPQLKQAIQHCTACGLHKTRTQGVVGVGDENADWLIIGEAPGADEDEQGEPFVGQAGKLLDAMLAAIDLKRGENIYIANVLKSRPPGNRNPAPEEVAACLPYLLRQIELIQPKIILAMGRFAVQSLLQTEDAIAKLRGRVHQYQGVPLIVTYHPAYLLRNLPDKAKAWEDLCLARKTMQEMAG